MNNRKNPFIPIKDVKLMIVDGSAKEIIDTLKKMNIQIIPTIKCMEVYDAISYHPDIVIHPINYNTIIVAPNVFDYYQDIFKGTKIKVLKGEKKLTNQYPNNIAYNVARVSDYAIHNFKYTDEKLKYYLKKEGLNLISVKQGYSKCSVAIISDNAIITSDHSIYRELTNYDIDVLLIEQGHIELPGLNYGFIGGSTGLLSKRKILFTGKYSHHLSKEKIDNFLKKYEIEPIFLSNKKIIDLGSIIPLKCN